MNAQAAATGRLGSHPHAKVQSAQPSDIRCRVSGAGIVLAVEAQTSRQAWVEYDTEQSHFAQVFGPTNIHNKAEQPQYVTGVGPQAYWVPAQAEPITTNAQEGSLAAYVTVTVTHHRRGAAPALHAASVVAHAALAAAPRSG